MPNSLFNSLLGAGAQQAYNGLANGYSPYNQSLGQMNNAMAAQQYMMAQQRWATGQRTEWMINGCAVTFEEFVERVFPEDSPTKTHFLLKYSK
jgi:hypothetical protein